MSASAKRLQLGAALLVFVVLSAGMMQGDRPGAFFNVTIADTSANALIIGGAPGATSGTGGVKGGAAVFSTVAGTVQTASQPNITGVGALAAGSLAAGFTPVTVPLGGTGLATLTNHGVLLGQGTSPAAVTAAGTAGFVLTGNGAGADPTFQQSVYRRLCAASGTYSAAGAGNISGLTCSISGLTSLDSLLVVLTYRNTGSADGVIYPYNSTDSVTIWSDASRGGANSALGNSAGGNFHVSQILIALTDPSGLKDVGAIGSNEVPLSVSTGSTFTTNWTGSWSLVVRCTGTSGSIKATMVVYQLPGQ